MTHEGAGYATVFINPEQQKAGIISLTNGNLLLGANSHSHTGIMRPVWRPVDEEWMVKGVLLLGEDEATRMQMAIARIDDRN